MDATEKRLCAELEAWCGEQGLPFFSADELACERLCAHLDRRRGGDWGAPCNCVGWAVIHREAPRKDSTMPRQRKLGFHLTLKTAAPRSQIAALPAEDQANLAYDVFGTVADRLTERGIDPEIRAR